MRLVFHEAKLSRNLEVRIRFKARPHTLAGQFSPHLCASVTGLMSARQKSLRKGRCAWISAFCDIVCFYGLPWKDKWDLWEAWA